MYQETPQELQEQAYNVMEIIEDNVEYLCDEYTLSGEKVWVMISALSDYKLAEFSSSPDIEYEDELEEESDNEDWTNNIDDSHFEEDN